MPRPCAINCILQALVKMQGRLLAGEEWAVCWGDGKGVEERGKKFARLSLRLVRSSSPRPSDNSPHKVLFVFVFVTKKRNRSTFRGLSYHDLKVTFPLLGESTTEFYLHSCLFFSFPSRASVLTASSPPSRFLKTE